MVSVNEALLDSQPLPIHEALEAGIDVLAGPQTVEFIPYVRQVLPIDGFVFWVRADLLTLEALAAAGLSSPTPIQVEGSLHYTSLGSQVEDETIVIRRVDFTVGTPVEAFGVISPKVIYVGVWGTALGPFKFTFSQRISYYLDSANMNHYVGDAVYPVFNAQLIDSVAALTQRQVVSNSLPIWLSMMKIAPYPTAVVPNFDIYPSYLVPDNLVPPYIAVDIPPAGTRPLQSIPYLGPRSEHFQLMAERVRLTLYGFRNDEAMDLFDYVLHYSELTNLIGIMTPPVLRDDHRVQVELATMAMKKTLDLEVSYLQSRVREVARQIIQSTVTTWYPSDLPIPLPPASSFQIVQDVGGDLVKGFPIGEYFLFETTSGDLAIRAPDGDVTIWITHT